MCARARARPKRQTALQAAETAACVHAFAGEVLRVVPLKANIVETEFIQQFESCDPGVELQVLMAVKDKDAKFAVTDLPVLRELVEGHSKAMPINAAADMIVKANLDEESYKLLKKQLAYDVEAFKVFRRRVREVEHSVFYRKLQERERALANELQAAASSKQQALKRVASALRGVASGLENKPPMSRRHQKASSARTARWCTGPTLRASTTSFESFKARWPSHGSSLAWPRN